VTSTFAATDGWSGPSENGGGTQRPGQYTGPIRWTNVAVRRELLRGLERLVEARLRQCSLYDPSLDLAVEDAAGRVAGYALFWLDDTTLVGLLEPMRVHDEYQRRGLARMLLTNGLDRLARKGARLKVGFETDAARNLYLGAGFVRTSIDRRLVRPVRHEQGAR
jgi:predicted N-acetyltransferase YhbS